MNLVYVSAITVRSTSREEFASFQDDYISDMTMLDCRERHVERPAQ